MCFAIFLINQIFRIFFKFISQNQPGYSGYNAGYSGQMFGHPVIQPDTPGICPDTPGIHLDIRP